MASFSPSGHKILPFFQRRSWPSRKLKQEHRIVPGLSTTIVIIRLCKIQDMSFQTTVLSRQSRTLSFQHGVNSSMCASIHTASCKMSDCLIKKSHVMGPFSVNRVPYCNAVAREQSHRSMYISRTSRLTCTLFSFRFC